MSGQLRVTCFVCKSRYSVKPEQEGKVMVCHKCKEKVLLLPDDHPQRSVEVWFSKTERFSETTIDRLKRFIEATDKRLDIAIYSLTHEWLKPSFRELRSRRVAIRIVMDKTQAGCKKADDEYYRDELGIDVRPDCCSGLMHHKFAIRDDDTVLTGSYNWTEGAEGKEPRELLSSTHAARCEGVSQGV
jgi:phosphatidylserine/phosphatidylglycerophosphate/cardiolipin synthase-like enzyme